MNVKFKNKMLMSVSKCYLVNMIRIVELEKRMVLKRSLVICFEMECGLLILFCFKDKKMV